MQFTPKSDKEIAEENLWPVGIYSFEITDAEDYTSQKGNEMIKLTISVFNDDGVSRTLFDYLTDTMMYKLKHACYACGNSSNYESGDVRAIDFRDKTGQLKLGIKKDKAGQYADQNNVTDYIVDKDEAPTAHEKAKQNGFKNEIDDEIPF